MELDVLVPPAGNLWLAGRQLWAGPRLAGRTLTIWADRTSIHLTLDGAPLKTLPSRYTPSDLQRLLGRPGARPGGPPPATAPAAQPDDTDTIEVDRLVSAAGLVGLGNRQLAVGVQLAGRRVILRVEAAVVHVIADNTLVRTVPSPVPAKARARLRGARLATEPLPAPTSPKIVQRVLSCRGGCQVAGQRLHVGLAHAGKIVTVAVHEHRFDVLHEGVPLRSFPRTTQGEITRHKAYHHKNN